MTSTNSSEEEEEGAAAQGGRPNLYWKLKREREELERAQAQDSKEGYGGAFRGVPIPHPGPQTVTAANMLGSEELCWCGEPFDHDWPGKASGVKHPKGNNVSAMAEESAKIHRDSLKAYDDDIASIIQMAVNQYGCRFKVNKSTIVVWPTDESSPKTFGKSSGKRDVPILRRWFARHVVGLDEQGNPKNPLIKEADVIQEDYDQRATREAMDEATQIMEEQARALAEALESEEKKAKRAKDSAKEPKEEWVGLMYADGSRPIENFVTNGTQFKCVAKTDKGVCGWITESRTSIAGHKRTRHSDTSTLWGPEAKARSSETYRLNKLADAVNETVVRLAALTGIQVGGDTNRVAELEAQVEALTAEAHESARQLAECRQANADLEAKLALIREGLGL